MRFGTVSFQANDKNDVFYVTDLAEAGLEPSDETLIQVEDTQFESERAWVTGDVPQIKPVHVEGDTSIVHAWIKVEKFERPFVVTVYIECETAEELEEVRADEPIERELTAYADLLDPIEINL